MCKSIHNIDVNESKNQTPWNFIDTVAETQTPSASHEPHVMSSVLIKQAQLYPTKIGDLSGKHSI